MLKKKLFRPFIIVTTLALTLSWWPSLTTRSVAASTASLSPALQEWLKTAGDAATFQTIVTFDDYESLKRIDALDVGATKLSRLPIAFATLTAAQIRQIAAWPEVRSLWHDEKNQIYLAESIPLIKADKVWAGAGLKRPYTGAGVGVAVIDTGVDSTHPDLPTGTKAEPYMVAGHPFERQPMVVQNVPTVDTYGHGTHVSSTIGGLGTASGGRYKGVAPGAKIYSFKTDVGAVLLDSFALASFDWMLANPGKVQVSSNSWGSGDGTDYNPDDPINVATKALYDAGITVVFAASNSGGPNTLNQYATSPWVISVAAGTKDLKLASFSSRGRFADTDPNRVMDINWDRRRAQRNNSGIYRPTITAPGVDINAAKSAQATLMATGTDTENPFYTYAQGTSMAAPHVAGVAALMLEARPSLKPQHIIDILEGTADNLPNYEIFEVGMGHLDALEAVQAAEKGKTTFPPSVNGKTPSFTQLGYTPISGRVLPGTWAAYQCPDTTGLLNQHVFNVAPGTDAIYAEIDWGMNVGGLVAGPELLYLVLYAPDCSEAAASAALLDIGSVNHRALLVTSPTPGAWRVAIYGRVNALTEYRGGFSTYDKK